MIATCLGLGTSHLARLDRDALASLSTVESISEGEDTALDRAGRRKAPGGLFEQVIHLFDCTVTRKISTSISLPPALDP